MLQQPSTTQAMDKAPAAQVALTDPLPPSEANSYNRPPVSAASELMETSKAKFETAKLKTAMWDHYIGFFTLKASGLMAIAVAASELLDPTLIPIVLDPLSAAAAGFAFLTGKNALSLIAKITASDNKEQK